MPLTSDYLVGPVTIPAVDALNPDIHPQDWDPVIRFIMPMLWRSAPITMILAQLAQQTVASDIFNWGEEGLPPENGEIDGVFTDQALSAALAGAQSAGATFYVQVAAEDCRSAVPGMTINLRDSTTTNEYACWIESQRIQGADSYWAVVLLEDDADAEIADADQYYIVGDAQPEDGDPPKAITRIPRTRENYCQILRVNKDLSGSKLSELERFMPNVEDRARLALWRDLQIRKERTIINGVKASKTLDGKRVLMTRGILSAFKEEAPGQMFNFALDTAFAGKTWIEATGGRRWLNKTIETLMRFSQTGHKVMFTGSEANLAITEAVEANGTYHLQPRQTETGLQISDWYSPQGMVTIVQHGQWTLDPIRRKWALIMEPEDFKWCPKEGRDDQFLEDVNDFPADGVMPTKNARDGKSEGWMCQGGVKYWNIENAGLLVNLGADNELTP